MRVPLHNARGRLRAWYFGTASLLALVGATCGVASAASETEATVVTAEVLSATNIDSLTACTPGSAATDFGAVATNTSVVTAAPCTVTFGSSNDTSMLLAYQEDGAGVGMFGLANGDPDAAFAGGTSTLDSGATGGDYIGDAAIAVQPDGKILAAGWTNDAGVNRNVVVARFDTDGSPDNTFNGTGYRVIDLGTNNDQAYGVIVDAAGRILVSGSTSSELFVMRLTTLGATDNSFNGTGISLIDAVPGNPDGLGYIEVDSQGRIVLAGRSVAGGIASASRLLPDGTFDPAFNGGTPLTHLDGGATYFFGVDVGPDDKMYFSGQSTLAGDRAMLVVRLDVDGSLDDTFAGDGSFEWINTGFDSHAWEIAVRPDGGAYIVGQTTDDNDGIIMSVTSSGGLDPGFNGGVPFVWDNGADAAQFRGAAIVPGRGVLAAGNRVNGADTETVVYGALDSGAPDPDFGTAGFLISDIAPAADDNFRGISMGVDGAVSLTGRYWDGAEWDILAARLESVPVADYDPGVTDWSTGANTFGACLVGSSNAVENGSTWATDVNAGSDCADGDADPWEPIAATSGGASAKVLESDASGQIASTASIHFGLRTSVTQADRDYVGAVTFEAVAPNV